MIIVLILGGIVGYWFGYFVFDVWLVLFIESWGYIYKIDMVM